MNPLLGLGSLRRLPVESRPLVRPGTVPAGIVHIGLGAFHRAHQALYTEEALAAAGGDWGIVGVAPRSTAVVAALEAQDLLYSVSEVSAEGTRARVVGAFAGARAASADPDSVVALLADPAIRVVTLCMTEKAYRLDPATGRLLDDPALDADLRGDRPPTTVPGLLFRGLVARSRTDAGPIAIVSCDNFSANGRRTGGMLEAAYARAGHDDSWLRANVRCPGTMVDRIVPASTDASRAAAAALLGVRDEVAVYGEPYRQWVIEDDFPAGRPAWETAGAVLTDDAGPWERLKLRSLNGVHSAMAYLGALAGCETIADAYRMAGLADAMRRFVAEDVAPSFTPPDGVSVVEYGESALERFANPAIVHRTTQVAMDGSQKLPQRVLETIRDRRAAGGVPRYGALVVAAWMRYARGVADDGRSLTLDDPLADRIRAAVADAPASPEGLADALFGLTAVFPADLAADETVRGLVVEWLTELDKHGVESTLAGVR
ncbi:mannitol dehydrogenase family protein [Asanoa sp. WMMD1127]|uniref:mannitol dehydrogenase family protein n=1 Tax=Asanoa sp. WMMD1127 TaxID=3016107 RepID=UPI0024170F33|nr:mannitol dehydrogenase family protein [Asanoa sp. WMMD1127]MDG4823905.1 mannitol dehydrogenase family protein [Asanoa sp. WMMD1127]